MAEIQADALKRTAGDRRQDIGWRGWSAWQEGGPRQFEARAERTARLDMAGIGQRPDEDVESPFPPAALVKAARVIV